MKNCPKCGAAHEKSGNFCSKSCANSRQWSPEDKKKLSLALKGKPSPHLGKTRGTKINKICQECSKEFLDSPANRKKYCSLTCSRKNAGGYRENSGRAKTGYYKGIYCGSTYELCWLIYQLDHNLEVSRFSGSLEYKGKKYIPDFLQNGKIVEIKGYESQQSVDTKTKVANALGYEVLLLRKEDLNSCFEWVKKQYNTSKFFELYDNYRPKYVYCCSFCSNNFETDRRRTTEQVYCGRSCSMKGTASLNREQNKEKISKTLTGRKKPPSSKGRTQPFQG